MIPYKELSKEELLEIKSDLDAQFEAIKAKGLNLDKTFHRTVKSFHGNDGCSDK